MDVRSNALFERFLTQVHLFHRDIHDVRTPLLDKSNLDDFYGDEGSVIDKSGSSETSSNENECMEITHDPTLSGSDNLADTDDDESDMSSKNGSGYGIRVTAIPLRRYKAMPSTQERHR